MQEDKALKELIQQFAIEETPADFTQNIMHHIEAKVAAKHAAKSLVSSKLFWALTSTFILVVGSLLVLSFKMQLAALPLSITLNVPKNYVSQLTWFIIVFWVVMLTNIAFQHKNRLAI